MYNSIKEEHVYVKAENYGNTDAQLEEQGNDSEEDEDLTTIVNVLPTPSKSTKTQAIGNVPSRNDYIFPSSKNPVICTAEENLHKNIWDTVSWDAVIDEARIMKIEDARQIYERALEQFPTSGKIWRYYAEHEFKTKNYDKVELILSKSLYQCPNVNIWEFYIDYVRDIHLDSFERVPMDERKRKLDTVKEACETAINNIGFHINSNRIWKKYIEIKKKYRDISYLGIANVNNDIREAYQRALCIPMNELEDIFDDYRNFEKDKGYERYFKEQEAKKSKSLEIYSKKKEYWQRILNDELATPPTGTEKEREQLIVWKKAIEFDKLNPRKLSKEEHRFHMRILYMQCLCIMRFHVDIWYDFALFENSFNDIVSSKQIFEQASTILTDSLILQFAYCDFLESQGLKDETKALYERLLTKKHSNEHQTLIYIIYQKFLLRNEGLMASRNLFTRARNDPKCDYHIYEASADIELYYNHNSSISRKIYQVCYDKYKTNTSFLSDYIDFLESIGDSINMKALYQNIFNNQEIKISDQLKLRYLAHLLISEDKTKNLNQLMKNQCKLDCLDENLYSDSLCYCNRFTNGLHACNVIDQSLEERYCDLFNIKYDRKTLKMKDEEKKRIKKERKENNKEFENDPNLPNFVKSWLRIIPIGSQSRTPDSTIDLVLDFLSMELPPQPND